MIHLILLLCLAFSGVLLGISGVYHRIRRPRSELCSFVSFCRVVSSLFASQMEIILLSYEFQPSFQAFAPSFSTRFKSSL